ncbi:MAG: dihydroorotase family protein [Thermoproteota archaeon]|nr:dihydroorotase family protein [Candidatus Brockarchaeota archaeon]
MTHLDRILTGRIYHEGDFIEGCVGVSGGDIVFIGKEANAPSYDEKIDFGRLIIVPGLIDIHVHLRGMRLKHKEDFLTGTCAAAAGGFTLVLDMPNTEPPTNNHLRMMEKIEEASDKIVVDVGFYFGKPENRRELEKLLNTVAIGVKLYPEDYCGAERGELAGMLKTVAESGRKIVFHPEDLSVVKENRSRYPAQLKGVEKHGFIRPLEAELSALDLFRKLSEPGSHATHLTSVRSIRKARVNGFTFDVSVNHLALSDEDLSSMGSICKVNPPLRSPEERSMLVESLNKGEIPIVATDHAPHTVEEKSATLYDEVPSGIPGFETAFPVLLDMVNRGFLNLHRVLEALTKGPAGFLGDTKLGGIVEGNVANLTVFNPKEEWRVNPEDFYTKAKHSPFKNRVLKGRVKATLVRGELVFQDNEIMVSRGFGKIYGLKHP